MESDTEAVVFESNAEDINDIKSGHNEVDEEDKAAQRMSMQNEDRESRIVSTPFEENELGRISAVSEHAETPKLSFLPDDQEMQSISMPQEAAESQRISVPHDETERQSLSIPQEKRESELTSFKETESQRISMPQDDKESQRMSKQDEGEKKLSLSPSPLKEVSDDEEKLNTEEIGPKPSLLEPRISVNEENEDKVSRQSKKLSLQDRQSTAEEGDEILAETSEQVSELPVEEAMQPETISIDQKETEETVIEQIIQVEEKDVLSSRKSAVGEDKKSVICCGGRVSVADVKTIEDINNIVNDRLSLIGWCIKMGLIVDSEICPNCESPMNWVVQQDHRLYWVCPLDDPTCRQTCVKGRIPFNCQGLTINKMARLLFMLYNQDPLDDVLSETKLRKEDYESFENIFREACIYCCKKANGTVGGENICVNIELGKRMGRNKPDQTVIGGIEEGDCGKIFFGQIPSDKSLEEIKQYLKTKISPNSVVNSNSAERTLIEDLEWNHSDHWTLRYNSGCLAKDLWRQHLVGYQNEFEALAKSISEYFIHHRSKHV